MLYLKLFCSELVLFFYNAALLSRIGKKVLVLSTASDASDYLLEKYAKREMEKL